MSKKITAVKKSIFKPANELVQPRRANKIKQFNELLEKTRIEVKEWIDHMVEQGEHEVNLFLRHFIDESNLDDYIEISRILKVLECIEKELTNLDYIVYVNEDEDEIKQSYINIQWDTDIDLRMIENKQENKNNLKRKRKKAEDAGSSAGLQEAEIEYELASFNGISKDQLTDEQQERIATLEKWLCELYELN